MELLRGIMNNPKDCIGSVTQKLLSGIISDPDYFVVRPQSGGGNNKVFILEREGTPEYIMKQYFQHAADPRDRCRAEWTFLEYAAKVGISCVPKPVICDHDQGIAIYQYISGSRILTNGLHPDYIDQALSFFEAINRRDNTGKGKYLQPAAEACFCLQDHLECVNRRIMSLLQIDAESSVDREAIDFVRQEISPRWKYIQTHIHEQEILRSHGSKERLSDRDIIISPSDFGFHNAILSESGTVFFIDFEYAGLDDPVKMICDFFCQPEVPIPHSYLPSFSDRVLRRMDNPEYHRHRIRILMPAYILKWCCIILNEFLPLGRARRMFAKNDPDIDAIKEKQLNKARGLLSTID
ncbi:phosphotransferase [Methanoregula sp. UBA64]|jgi:thiamine kinase-like enzyme|uniref:phosphotransferase n=1 Tax=Methanoregula sp. UBA64 TaxID=1915554 RepID=UPI0025D4A13A|nr:phosphotransferase [Methanoregula sp. UBA64]